MNNLYGYAMSFFLWKCLLNFLGGYKWIDPNDFCSNKCSNNSTKGYVLEADLEYTKESHELHNDYPSAPVK